MRGSSRIATVSEDGSIKVWGVNDLGSAELATGRPPQVEGSLKTAMLSVVGWSPDGTRIASAGQDGQLLMWDNSDVDQAYVEEVSLEGHVKSVAFSPGARASNLHPHSTKDSRSD